MDPSLTLALKSGLGLTSGPIKSSHLSTSVEFLTVLGTHQIREIPRTNLHIWKNEHHNSKHPSFPSCHLFSCSFHGLCIFTTRTRRAVRQLNATSSINVMNDQQSFLITPLWASRWKAPQLPQVLTGASAPAPLIWCFSAAAGFISPSICLLNVCLL